MKSVKHSGFVHRKTAKHPTMYTPIPSALQPIFTRATHAGFKVELFHSNPDPQNGNQVNPVTGLLIHLPNGNETRPFLIRDDERLHRYSNVKFEQMQFIRGTEASWSKSEDVLEAELQGDEITYNAVFLLKRLKHVFRPILESGSSIDSSLTIPYCRKLVNLEFAESSNTFNLLSNHAGIRPKLVVRISGIGANSHDEARNALNTLTESLLFQIKREYNIHLRLRDARGLFSENQAWSFPNGMLTLGS